MTTLENKTTYHEIDFLLPAQRFSISFSYITQKGLPFVREFVLRLVHMAPMTKSQLATYFGFSRIETEEAIADLVDRGELTLSDSGRLMLTEKAGGYFNDIGEAPRLSQLQDSGAFLAFDLATFTCLGKDTTPDKWKNGIPIRVDDENASRSEALAEKHFQRQFHDILDKGLLSKSLVQDEKDSLTVYTVNSVTKIRQMPFRLTVKFQLDEEGRSVEREDFELLNSSDQVHEKITVELNRLTRPSNVVEIAKAMLEIGDGDTLKLFDSRSNALNLQFLDDLRQLEENGGKQRTTFVGPIYSTANWGLLQKTLAPVLASRIKSKEDAGQPRFLWLAPSDPYWHKSARLPVALSDFLNKASTKEKRLYSSIVYLPVAGKDDRRTAKQWEHELDLHAAKTHGLVEGFLGGNVEILHFDGEFVAVVYHFSVPPVYPVTFPLGFMSTDKRVVSEIGRLVQAYVEGSAGYERKNDCGPIARLGRIEKN